MTNRKLKRYVLPTVFVLSIFVIALSTMFITKSLKTTTKSAKNYVMDTIIENITPVVNTDIKEVIKPYISDKVSVYKSFYDKDATEEQQQNSLIYYENTYLQNSGIIYSSNEEFDVIAVEDGTIVDIKEDEMLNTVVYVSHDNNITTIYYGLKDVTLKVNDQVSQGQVLGKSNNNKFCQENSSILFEVNNDGQVINPEEFFSMNQANIN